MLKHDINQIKYHSTFDSVVQTCEILIAIDLIRVTYVIIDLHLWSTDANRRTCVYSRRTTFRETYKRFIRQSIICK